MPSINDILEKGPPRMDSLLKQMKEEDGFELDFKSYVQVLNLWVSLFNKACPDYLRRIPRPRG